MVDEARAGQRPRAARMVLGEAADRLDRDVARRVPFDRHGRHGVVVDIGLAPRGQADGVLVDLGDLAVDEDPGAEQLELPAALGTAGVGGRGKRGRRR